MQKFLSWNSRLCTSKLSAVLTHFATKWKLIGQILLDSFIQGLLKVKKKTIKNLRHCWTLSPVISITIGWRYSWCKRPCSVISSYFFFFLMIYGQLESLLLPLTQLDAPLVFVCFNRPHYISWNLQEGPCLVTHGDRHPLCLRLNHWSAQSNKHHTNWGREPCILMSLLNQLIKKQT